MFGKLVNFMKCDVCARSRILRRLINKHVLLHTSRTDQKAYCRYDRFIENVKFVQEDELQED